MNIIIFFQVKEEIVQSKGRSPTQTLTPSTVLALSERKYGQEKRPCSCHGPSPGKLHGVMDGSIQRCSWWCPLGAKICVMNQLYAVPRTSPFSPTLTGPQTHHAVITELHDPYPQLHEKKNLRITEVMINNGECNKDNNNHTVCAITMCSALV